jgi:hypothetical protein
VTGVRLAKLPARTPVRLTIAVTPDLYRTLERYAECYRETYGETEKVADLIPFMLEAFLASDKEFAKARKSTTAIEPNNSAQ